MNNQLPLYSSFLHTPTREHWERIGLQKRSGVAVPLFSVYSRQSLGIGELADLKKLIDWCGASGISMIQLLPLNDVGFRFTPYDAQSSFALDPMYLAVGKIKGLASGFRTRLQALGADFPCGQGRVDYNIKAAKLRVLWDIYRSLSEPEKAKTDEFQLRHKFWLQDYCLYKAIKETQEDRSWEEWPDSLKLRDPQALQAFKENHAERIGFHQWLQSLLAAQFEDVKQYASAKRVLIMGDMPFLVSRDSADVWAHQEYFKLNLSAGAPPDMYFARGQRWGMPPYNWEEISRHNYDYVIGKLHCLENYYDLYRIDHFVGLFRIWTISIHSPREEGGLHGHFDPPQESDWEEHGKKILEIMLRNSSMLPCAEDLGTVPPCSYKVIREYAIAGMDIQRWMRDWEHTFAFKSPDQYRPNSLATLATHDMTDIRSWWEHEAGTVDELGFRIKLQNRGFDIEDVIYKMFEPAGNRYGRLRWRDDLPTLDDFLYRLGRPAAEVKDMIELYQGTYSEKSLFLKYLGLDLSPRIGFSDEMMRRVLEKISQTASIFSIQLLQDWLSVNPMFHPDDSWEFRINFPGTVSEKNWTLTLPISLEAMCADRQTTSTLKEINRQAGRN